LIRLRSSAADGFVKRRAGLEDEQERRLFFEYFWTALCAQPISSDKWVNAFLVPVSSAEHPGLYGRRPLADEPAARLASLPPCTVIFGDLDWVMTQSALDAAPALPGGRLHVVKGGFHHLYFDMPEKFHAMVAEALA
jgi:pimeloyl-ACP methyl ester carboxylesterase